MFSFFNKKAKKIDTKSIIGFTEAMGAIKVFILLSEWEKAGKALSEIKIKEKDKLDEDLKILSEKDLRTRERGEKKLRADYESKLKKITKISMVLEEKERKYIDTATKEKFKIRFKKIKEEIEHLTGSNNNTQALAVLQSFLEENKENSIVIKFYNKEKRIIQRNVGKQKRIENEKMKKNARLEALKLIWGSINIDKPEETREELAQQKTVLWKLKSKLNFYKNLKDRIRKKRLMDEITLLIEEDNKVKNDIAAKKLENIHKWLVKELSYDSMRWYELYGKILWADKISWDTFWIHETNDSYKFFLWDATGHGIRAGFIVTLLSRLFTQFADKLWIWELSYEINNGLKQDLKSRNFITAIFFEIIKSNPEKVKYVGMWHEAMFIYRHKTKKIEKVIPGGLAGWIRMMKTPDEVRVKEFDISHRDIILSYSDGIVESKSPEWEQFGHDRLQKAFMEVAQHERSLKKIYDYLVNDLQVHRSGSSFTDDVSLLLFSRNVEKDVVEEDSQYIQDISLREGIHGRALKKLEWKTKAEIQREIEKIKEEKEVERILKHLEWLFYTWEILKLKQECIRLIKKGHIHKKINFYLKKAIDNETKYKIEQKNQKMQNRYILLKELQKKWDNETVIREIEEIISKDGNL